MDDAQPILRSNLSWFFAIVSIVCGGAVACLGLLTFVLLVLNVYSPAELTLAGLGGLLVMLGVSVVGLVCGRMTLLTGCDLMLPSPVLQIDDVGILDQRLGCGRIPWSNIAKVTSLDSEQAGLLIKLRGPVDAEFSRLRAGALGVVCRLPKSTVYVSMHAAMGPWIAPAEILTIAKQHGVVTAAWRLSKLTGRPIPVGN